MDYTQMAKEISKLTNEQLSALAMKCIELGIAVPLEHALHEAQLDDIAQYEGTK
jgi:hypothetical protein